jgi:hypothetical protein
MTGAERGALIHALAGSRANRRHRPNRGFERVRYRFEVVSDYGAFRDLQRHRMLTVQWQGFSPDLGAHVPEELAAAGVIDEFERSIDSSREEFVRLQNSGLDWAAPYALCMAFRTRYVLDMTAREAMHLIELRSGSQGHATYRVVAQDMFDQIESVHPSIAGAMSFVDKSRPPVLRSAIAKLAVQDQMELGELLAITREAA